MMLEVIDIIILTLMTVTVIGIVVMRNLLAVVMLGGIYSLLAASIFVALDGVVEAAAAVMQCEPGLLH